MKLRESGMPNEAYWESLFDVPLILDRLGIDASVHDVAELGCGYGTFSVPVAKRITGKLYTFDLEPDMVDRVSQRACEAGLVNLIGCRRDVVSEGYGLQEQSLDGFLLFNILHGENPVDLLTQAAHLVRSGGWIWVIHWRYDPATPRGPSMDIRPRPEQIPVWAESAHLLERQGPMLDLPPWHYGWQFRKQ